MTCNCNWASVGHESYCPMFPVPLPRIMPSMADDPDSGGTGAPGLLDKAARHMRDRAATYDKPGGERSMSATVTAFNAITGHDLRESEGWLLQALLKMVRSETRDEPHADSVEDLIAYSALFGESRLGGR
jgi:hypothetical protein